MVPEVQTVVDIHETSNIPILLSLPQMRDLGFSLNLTPDTVELTCPSLGYERETVQQQPTPGC
eukprot:12915295-Prorocentrum_lima.AAC.1